MKQLNRNTIISRMEEKGYNQAGLAEFLGVSREAVSKWLKGESVPRPALLLKLGKALSLSFTELVIDTTPALGQFAYRTNKNQKLDTSRQEKANDMMQVLSRLNGYLTFDSMFSPTTLSAPLNDYSYLQQAVRELRNTLGIPQTDPVHEMEIIDYFKKHSTVFLPVLWGSKGDNALHISLAESPVHFIYLNLQKPVSDFKYWLLHELSHILTPMLQGDKGEKFADAFASTFLYPAELAATLHERLTTIPHIQARIEEIVNEASAHMISPISVLQQVNNYARFSEKEEFDIQIFAVTTNYSKSVRLVSEILFEEDTPTVEKYIAVTARHFGNDLWKALGKWIQADRVSPSLVQKLLDIPMSDAKGVLEELAPKKDPS